MKSSLVFIVLFLLGPSSYAKLGKTSSKAILKPFYLSKTDSRKLQKELVKAKLSSETFTLTFKCDKYKRTPSAKKKSLNCLAVSVSPD